MISFAALLSPLCGPQPAGARDRPGVFSEPIMSCDQLTEENIAPIPERIGDWHHIGAVWDEANRAKDREDEALDAMRVHNGMTLDEFLATQ
jgi:hypothetical protein